MILFRPTKLVLTKPHGRVVHLKHLFTAFCWCFLGLPATFLALPAAAELGRGELAIAGTRLVVSPESQTVPFDTPTIVETALEGYDLETGSLPPSLRVVGELSGPEIDGLLVLETVPGQPLRIPALRLQGEYLLRDLRLLDGETLLAYASPRDVVVRVDQVLVTRVTSRALTLEEIASYGIVVDDDNFQAFNFTFAFGVAGHTVDYNVPVVFQPGGGGSGGARIASVLSLGEGTLRARFRPPQIAPFQFRVRAPGTPQSGGCTSPFGDCVSHPPPPIPGVLLFPADIGLLHQFFSVVLLAGNGAPAGDPLVIRDLAARIRLPAGLRQAETTPPTPLGVPVPVRVPGPDGEVGTADDISFLVAQATGEAEFLVEGLREGTHIVSIDLAGLLEGLPGGIQRIEGEAKGAVIVRDPTFGITVHHPEVVRAGEEYTLGLTLANTSSSPANLVTVSLPASGLSGVEVVGERQVTLDTLLPGDSQLVELRLRSLRTGKVVATAARSDQHLRPTFDITTSVGEAGIPLSPTSIVLPRSTELLPEALRRSALALVGLGFSIASAPQALLAVELPRVSRASVDGRVYELAQAGRVLRLGEELFDAAAVLAVEWTGAGDGDLDWDRLRRATANGAATGDSLAQVFAAEAVAGSARAACERFAAATAYLPPLVLAMAEGDELRLEVESLATGRSLEGSGTAADRVRDLPFADLFRLGAAELALVARPEPGGYRVRVRPEPGAGGGGSVTVVSRDAGGSLRETRWTSVNLGTGGSAWVDLVPGAGSPSLAVDANGDGLAEQQLAGSATTLAPRPFEVVGVVQNGEVDPTGHVVEVLFSQDVALGSLLPRDPDHFVLPGKVSNGGLVAAEAQVLASAAGETGNPFAGLRNSRVVRVVFDNPLSPYVAHSLAVEDIDAAAGSHIESQIVPVLTTVTTPGTLVAGRVIGGDGQPVPFARVELLEADPCPFCLEAVCIVHPTAAIQADGRGEFLFDYVRQTGCGEPFTLEATDPQTTESGRARGAVRFLGETVRLDVVMVGRGTVRGRVRYEDGTAVPEISLQLVSAALQQGRQVQTDANGNYQASELAVGTIVIAARDADGNSAAATVELPAAGAVVERDLTIVRRPADELGEVSGRVFEPDGATPVAGAWVALYHGGTLVRALASDGDGRFALGPVLAGQAEIEAFSGETGRAGARLFFEVLPDRMNEVAVLLVDERGAVEGLVRRRTLTGALEPVPLAVVWAAGTLANARTDASGFYRLEGVFAGSQTIRAADPDTFAQAHGSVTVVDGETVPRDLVFETAASSGAVAGEVLGYDGTPVPGATVHRAVSDVVWSGETATDGAGRFVLGGLGPGTYAIHAVRGADGGVATATVRFAGDTPFVTIRFKKGTVRGRVLARNESGELIGVETVVRARMTEVRLGLVGLATAPRDLETASDGSFELGNVLAGPYVLTAFNGLYGEQTVRGTLTQHGEVIEHPIVFEPAGTVEGTVYDHDGSTPVEGARVWLRHPALADYDVLTDEAGRFRFELVAPHPARYPLDVRFEDGVVLRLARVWVQLRRPGQTVTADVVLPRQGGVAGRVEDSNGELVPGARVTLKEAEYPARTLVQEADANGAFAFDNVFEGSVTLTAKALHLGGLGGKLTVEIDEEGDELTELVIRLQDTGAIAGQVQSPVDSTGVPAAEVRLYRSGHLVETLNADALGEFRFELLPLGTYELKAFDPASGRAGRETGLVLSANGQELSRYLVLEARGSVEGHLFEPQSTVPVPGATVKLRSQSIVPLTAYSSTDGDGFFDFGGIPQGTFTLTVREPDGRRTASGTGEITAEDEVVILDLYLEASGTVSGTVRTPLGVPDGPFTPVNVVLRQDGQVVGSSLDASYHLEGAIAGRRFDLEASEPGGLHRGEASGTLTAEGEDYALDVRMVPIGSVEVSVVDSFGNPVPGADVRLHGNSFYSGQNFNGSTGADHRITFPQVGAGALSAYATNPVDQLKGSTTASLALEGELVQLTVELQDSGEVRGTVLLADGATPATEALAVVRIASRTYTTQADSTGFFRFPAVPLGSFTLDFQEHLGPGVRRVTGTVTANGQVVDLGTVVLDDRDPEVSSISPTAGTVEVGVGAVAVVRFSEPIDTAAFGSSWITLKKTSGASVTVSRAFSDGGATVTLTPGQPLASFTSYQVRVSTDVKDPAGRRLAAAVAASFTTADVVPPAVLSVVPASGATQVPLDSALRLEFSEAIVESSLSGSALELFDSTAGAGVGTSSLLLPSQRTVAIEATEPLLSEHDYRLTVEGVMDLSGNALAAPFAATFRTVDATPPEVLLEAPAGPLVEGVSYTLTATAVASPDLAAVSFFAGDRLLATDVAAPFAAAYTPTEADAAAGTMELSAVGRDGSGNLGPASVATRAIEPDLPPVVQVSVTPSQVIPGASIQVSGSVTDSTGIKKYSYVFSGAMSSTTTVSYGPGNTTLSLNRSFSVPELPAADYLDVVVKATDYLGKVTQTTPQRVAVPPDTQPPSISNVLPAAGSSFTSGDLIHASASASDAVRVTQVVFTLGEESFTDTSAPYKWDTAAPSVAASTPYSLVVEAFDPAGNRGVASRALTVDPLANPDAPVVTLGCPLAGDFVRAGRPVTVQFSAADDDAIETFTVKIDGSVIGSETALNQSTITKTVAWTVPAEAQPGDTFALSVEVSDYGANLGTATATLSVPVAAVLAGDQTLTAAANGAELWLAGGTFTADEPLAVPLLVLLDGARLVGQSGEVLALDVTGTARVQCGTAIDVSGLGYAGGTKTHKPGYAPAGVVASEPTAGGSHGGPGGAGYQAGAAGAVFDGVYRPALGGGGGSNGSGLANPPPAGAGGGVLVLTAGELVLHGELKSLGASIEAASIAAGAGGSVRVVAGVLSGRGTIDVSGGNSENSSTSASGESGGGGGGRVAIEAGAVAGFDLERGVKARGGARISWSNAAVGYGGAGTVFVYAGEAEAGTLRVDNGETSSGQDRVGPATALPPLVGGAFVALTADGPDAWLTSTQPFGAEWWGAWVALEAAGGEPLGSFRVEEIDPAGALRLAGASGALTAEAYHGEYRFDAVVVTHGAGLTTVTPLVAGTLEVEGATALSGSLAVERLTVGPGPAFGIASGTVAREIVVQAGAVLTAASGDTLRLDLERLEVEAGGLVSMNARGFAGGAIGHLAGYAPAGVTPSATDAGGSHGGLGGLANGAGPAGAAYDGVYLPQQPGAGGSVNASSTSYVGGAGGGVIDLTLGELALDGEITARGEDVGSSEAGGAGGAVVVQAGVVRGAGQIHVDGGATSYASSGTNAGGGGGGRIALYAAALDGFDPMAQLSARGGRRYNTTLHLEEGYGGPGTVYVQGPGSFYGTLLLDNGDSGASDRVGPVTPLPALGAGALAAFEVSGDDAWVSQAGGFPMVLLGAWVALADAAGAPLGAFRVLEIDGAGRALLEGASAAGAAATWQGEYRFDELLLANSGSFTASDPVRVSELVVPGNSQFTGPVFAGRLEIAAGQSPAALPAQVAAEEIELLPGAVLTAAGGSLLEVTADSLVLRAGAAIDMNKRGYAGGISTHQAGYAPDFVAPPSPDSGGSHGGRGIVGVAAGPSGEVFDSVSDPGLAGGGGSLASTSSGISGGAGGGVIVLDVGELEIEPGGQIRAAGETFGCCVKRGGGAGGTVVVRAGSIVSGGASDIDVRGGDGNGGSASTNGGGGGGGRVAILYDGPTGTAPPLGVLAYGGARQQGASSLGYAAPGTVYVLGDGEPAGDLYVEHRPSGITPARTVLPTIGSGTVGLAEPDLDDPADLWIEPAASGPVFDLGVTGMVMRIDGDDYRVIAQSPDRRRLRLEGAAGLVAVGDAYQGVYKLDRVTVTLRAVLELLDTAEIATEVVDANSQLIKP